MTYAVHKLNHLGETMVIYHGEVLQRGAGWICIRAAFSFSTLVLNYVTLKRGDIFTEWFYSDRWYNVFRVQDVDSGELKGFYCNLTRPAVILDDHVMAEDLALDLFVRPDGSTMLLDEDEFTALNLGDAERQQVVAAVAEILQLVLKREGPFADLPSQVV